MPANSASVYSTCALQVWGSGVTVTTTEQDQPATAQHILAVEAILLFPHVHLLLGPNTCVAEHSMDVTLNLRDVYNNVVTPTLQDANQVGVVIIPEGRYQAGVSIRSSKLVISFT